MKSVIIKILVLLVILSAPSYFIYKDYSSSDVVKNDEVKEIIKTSTTTSSVETKSPIVTTVKPGSIEIVQVDSDSVNNDDSATVFRGIMPNLDKPWSIPENYSVDAKAIINARITDITKELKADKDQYDKWIVLGNTRKLVEDYEEARNIWEFASLTWPDSIVAFHNLGDLYGYYLKDNIKAEVNMLKVIELNPGYIDEYISLYRLYEQKFSKQDPRAISILIKGLDANPASPDLMITLASHYRGIGDKVNARKYYEMALTRVKQLNNPSLQAMIEVELKNL